MTIIKAHTARATYLRRDASIYQGYYLSEVYGRPSKAKRNAWQACYEMCDAENGENFHICSHNSNFFCVAWETAQGIRLETGRNSYLILDE